MCFNSAKTLKIDDASMHYLSFGKGDTTLIILPGLEDGLSDVNRYSFISRFLYRKYAKHYKVYECSRKRPLPEDYSTKDMADDIKFFMDEKGIKKAHIMGFSMGGMIAQHFAADYPEYVDKLVISVSSPKLGKEHKEVIRRWEKQVDEGKYGEYFVDLIETTMTKKSATFYRTLYFLMRKFAKPLLPHSFVTQAKACMKHDASDKLPSIKSPTLVIGGGHDRVLGAKASKKIAQDIPNSRLIIYPRQGHAAFREAKNYDTNVLKFLLG